MEREELDRHVMFFPEEGAYLWRVVSAEERLAEERLAKEVRELEVNRSERRAKTSPAPLVRIWYDRFAHVPAAALPAKIRRVLKRNQMSLFPVEDIDPDGRKVRDRRAAGK